MSSDEPEKARATGETEDGTGAAGADVPGTADGDVDGAETVAASESAESSADSAAEKPADTDGDDDVDSGADDGVADDGTEGDSTEGGSTEGGSTEGDGTEGDGTEAEDEAEEGRSVPPRWALLGAAAFATAAFIVAAVFGVWWLVSATGDDAEVAAQRQDVTRVAGQAVTAFTELDHTKLDEYFSRQKELSTGELANQIQQAEKTYREAITKAKSKVTTTVHDVAVSELNDREGKASAIVAASADIKRGDQEGMKTMRLEVQLSRDGEDGPWKVSQIGDVPVTGGGQQ
ncbi:MULTISPECIES: hypothetical protein [Prauserella salsuginis group]|uniref:Mce-associated membrane protein n=1 Tax=Prauserella salsuginis TaxID=387889 RepID=A0ABW6G2D5_9PSEU|nr:MULTISPECIES: hypothetical protein [Prauserella salsuginis group]MCR3719862.1 hypothetical protein [Prauserella flava]MCR3736595.1 hypothetical protein [Prauserella salsuginis]